MSSSYPDVTTFKALSFDCYGTLVDYEAALKAHLRPLRAILPSSHPYVQDSTKLMQRFNALTDELQSAQPTLLMDQLLVQAFRSLVSELGVEDQILPHTIEAWRDMSASCPAFPDTIVGLLKLKKHFKLIILSNVDERNIASSVREMYPVEFDGVYTAETIGSYKPSHKNFQYLFEHAKEELGVDVDKGELLHVARSLKADHVANKELGFRSVWIARGGDTQEGTGVGGDYAEMKDRVAYEWKFQTIGDFADEVERQFAAKGL